MAISTTTTTPNGFRAAARRWIAKAVLRTGDTARPVTSVRRPSGLRKMVLKAFFSTAGAILILTPHRARRGVHALLKQVEGRIDGTWDCQHEQWVVLRTPDFATFRGCPNCADGFVSCRPGCASERREEECDCDLSAFFDPARAINVQACKHETTRVLAPVHGIYYNERCNECNAYARHKNECVFKEHGSECTCGIMGWTA